MRKGEGGFTFIELIVSMFVMSIVLILFGSTLYHFLLIPAWQGDQLDVVNDLRFALDTIQRDGVQAQSFTGMEAPDYGYFTWNYFDPASGTITEHTITYSYDADGGRLLREDSKESAVTAIASHVAAWEDVVFTPSDDGTSVTVSITITADSGRGQVVTETGTREIEMRVTP